MSRTSVEFHPAAIAEARAAREWYAERSPVAALAFLAELDLAVERVVEAPSRWPQQTEGTRTYVMHRFPFLVIYRDLGNTIQILAVAHGRRRPGYWRYR